jgi:hypothetical protein
MRILKELDRQAFKVRYIKNDAKVLPMDGPDICPSGMIIRG